MSTVPARPGGEPAGTTGPEVCPAQPASKHSLSTHSPAVRAPTLPSFEVLVTRHGAAVLRVCRALVGFVDADDVWQETFLSALRAYPSSGEVRNREAWLVTIARNKAMDHHRKAGRLPLLAVDSPGLGVGADLRGERSTGGPRTGDATLGGGDDVVRVVEAGQTAEVVWAAVATLPPTQQLAVVYHHLAGLRYVDVAALLGNSESAARRAASDGMKALRTLLVPSEGMEHDGRA